MTNRYYNGQYDFDGTLAELYTQVRNGYIMDKNAIECICDIAVMEKNMKSNPYTSVSEEMLTRLPIYLERANEADCKYQLGQYKLDILDGCGIEEKLADNENITLTLQKEQDKVLLCLEEITEDGYYTGANAVSVNDFINLEYKDFEKFVDETYAYGMVMQQDFMER